MRRIIEKIKKRFASPDEDEDEQEEYVELDTSVTEESTSKVVIRPFTLEDFSDVKEVLNALRDGKTIALINIKPLKEKDIVELKRAVNKLKKTVDVIDGDIAGFGDEWIVLTPKNVELYRGKQGKEVK